MLAVDEGSAGMDRYKVTITYSEPTYAQARGIEERTYVGGFEVTAFDPEAAIALATELFHEAQRCSGVAWVRENQGVELAAAERRRRRALSGRPREAHRPCARRPARSRARCRCGGRGYTRIASSAVYTARVTLACIEGRKDVAWNVEPRTITGRCDGLELTAARRWWGGRWQVTSAAPFPVPGGPLVFASRRGMEHGFWRDVVVGDRAFDAAYFIYSDVPALLPHLLGPATRAALRDRGPHGDDLTLYARGGTTRVTSGPHARDLTAIDRHLAVHRALATDHAACRARWREVIASAGGRAGPDWPPTATLLRPIGTVFVNLTWRAVPRRDDDADWAAAASSLRTELASHDERPRRSWSAHEVGATTPATHSLGGRRFVVRGRPSCAIPQLDQLVARAGAASIVCGPQVAVALHGFATASQLEAAARILHLVVEGVDAARRIAERAGRPPRPRRSSSSVIDELSDDATLADVQYRLYIIDAVNRGREEIAAGA